jgi:spore coat polysaccharide biosynthesis predicted glycosyltransferase SpsG
LNFKKQIILRADADSIIGHGHVYRLLALIENLGNEYYFHFCTYTQDAFLLQLIANKANKTTLLNRIIESNNKVKFDLENVIKENDTVVLDGYGFSNEYHEKIRKTGSKLIIVDDLVSPDITADVIINHAPGVRKEDYYNCRASEFYLGLNYALLRKEFYSLAQTLFY